MLLQGEVVCHLEGGEREGTGGDALMDASPVLKENPDSVGGSVSGRGLADLENIK